MPDYCPASRSVRTPSPKTWAAAADAALARGLMDVAMVLIEEAYAACDSEHAEPELAEAA